jgi:transcription elongation factor GreA
MQDEKKLVTKKGLKKLENELERRSKVVRKKIADKLDEAKAIGDLSENAAYTAAIEEYQQNEVRIDDLKKLIKKVVVAPDKSNNSVIDVGDVVLVKDLEKEEEVSYRIVGVGEGDPKAKQVSSDSVVGKAFLGKRVGEEVVIKLPAGEKRYKVLEIK